MNIESVPKFFAPKGMHVSDNGRTTASKQLVVTDVVVVLRMTQAGAGTGLFMFLDEAGTSENDRMALIRWLVEYAERNAPRPVRKVADRKFPLCMLIITRFAHHDYASSTAGITGCMKCAGKGFVRKVKMVEESRYMTRLPQWAKGLRQSPSDFEVKRQVQGVDLVLCVKCHSTEKISKRCQCSGTGKTLNRKESEL